MYLVSSSWTSHISFTFEQWIRISKLIINYRKINYYKTVLVLEAQLIGTCTETRQDFVFEPEFISIEPILMSVVVVITRIDFIAVQLSDLKDHNIWHKNLLIINIQKIIVYIKPMDA